MQQAVDMLHNEVDKSTASIQAIDSQTQLMQQVNKEYNVTSSILTQTRGILGRLGKRDFIDRAMLYLSLVFFLATCLYIIKRRLWFPDISFLWKDRFIQEDEL